MNNENTVSLIGRLGKNPEIRYTQNGTAVVAISICTPIKKFGNNEKKETPNWNRIILFNKLAEKCHQQVAKGDKVHVTGMLVTRKWIDPKSQENRYITEVIANNLSIISCNSNTEPVVSNNDAAEDYRLKSNSVSVSSITDHKAQKTINSLYELEIDDDQLPF